MLKLKIKDYMWFNNKKQLIKQILLDMGYIINLIIRIHLLLTYLNKIKIYKTQFQFIWEVLQDILIHK